MQKLYVWGGSSNQRQMRSPEGGRWRQQQQHSRDSRTELCSSGEERLLKELIDRGIIQEVGGLPVEANTMRKNYWLWWQAGYKLANLAKFKNSQFIADPFLHTLHMLPHLFLTTSLWSGHWHYFLSGILCFREFLGPMYPLPTPNPRQNCPGVMSYSHCLLWRIVDNLLFLLCASFPRSQGP